MDSSITSVLTGGAIATVASVITISYTAYVDRQRRVSSTATVVKAEIEAIMKMIELNNYVEVIRNTIARLRSGVLDGVSFRVTRSYTQVFDSHLSDLGLLADAAGEIVNFYFLFNSVLEDKEQIESDIQRGDAWLASHRASVIQRWIPLHEALAKKAEDLVSTGRRASAQLKKILDDLED